MGGAHPPSVVTVGTVTGVEAARLRRGALAALREGRVTVLTAATSRASGRPELVLAEVRGHTGRHVVELTRGGWSCSCSAGLCSHQVAVRLVCRDVLDLERVGS